MTAAIIRPIDFIVPASSPQPLVGSETRFMNLDVPGKVWRGGVGSSFFIVDLGPSPTYDFIALVGTNLRSLDTVRVRSGTTDTGIGGLDLTQPAWTGIKPDLGTAITVIPLTALHNERYVRIDITAPAHPSGYVQIQRLVIGRAATTVAIAYGAETTFDSRSDITSGPGFETVDEHDYVQSSKFRTAYIYDAEWRSNWIPMLLYAALNRGVLFIPEVERPDHWITDAVYGRLAKSGGKNEFTDAYVVEATITALSM